MPNLTSSEKDATDRLDLGSPIEVSLRERVRKATRQFESEIILATLEQHRWNRRRTAEALRISYRLLMYKMKSCDLRTANPAQRPPAN